jgi:colanic acid/amylovoran biosynthesis glycosyltransferase
MHIGVVLPAVPSYSETFFRNKIIGLQAMGIKVTLFANGPSKEFNLCPYYAQPPVTGLSPLAWIKTVYIFLLAFLKCPDALKRLFILDREQGKSISESVKTILANSHILQHKVDWLHFGFGTMVIGRENLAKAIGANMAISLRGYDINIYPLKFPGCYSLAWQRADKIHVLSDALLQKAISFGLPKNKIVQVITPAIDIKHFKTDSRASLGFGRPLKFLSVARLKWVKGLDYTLKALSLLKDQNISFEYSIIGEGEEYERLVFTAHQLGIREHVHFLGKQTPEEVKQAMENCDIYLQYSISEGFCNAVLEAQAMGCFCIVSDAEGLPENVLDGVTGCVVPKRKPENLAITLIHVATLSSDRLQKFRQNAISRVREKFNLEKQMEEFCKFYTT